MSPSWRPSIYIQGRALCCQRFCDKSAAVAIVCNLLANGYNAKQWINHKDRDLVATTAKLLSQKAPWCVRITWIKAHRELVTATSACDTVTFGEIFHNARADDLAKSALSLITADISEIRSKIKASLQTDAALRSHAAAFMRSMMVEY